MKPKWAASVSTVYLALSLHGNFGMFPPFDGRGPVIEEVITRRQLMCVCGRAHEHLDHLTGNLKTGSKCLL